MSATHRRPTSTDAPADATRRRFITRAGGAAAAPAALMAAGLGSQDAQAASYAFAHGVASGDPLADRVVLWTRVSASGDSRPRVLWEISTDASFARVLRSGLVRTHAGVDYTVKVDVTGLSPDTVYHYRFSCGAVRSAQGRTRTLPVGDVAQVKLAVFSCSNYPAGYFHAYALAARMTDVHAALHLGDFIYEYERTGYASEDAAALNRQVNPATECLTLADYRARHATYRSDADLQALCAAMPLIAVWDDHEVANNTYVSGAGNHTAATEGVYTTRRDAAVKAYHEWLPTRLADPSQPMKIYRSFDFGRLLSLHMLETRLLARTVQLSHASYVTPSGIDAEALDAAVNASSRQLLGSEQLSWLQAQMGTSTATWQVLGQQVRMAEDRIPAAIQLGQISIGGYGALQQRALTQPESLSANERYILAQPGIASHLDAWDGYGAERAQVLELARSLDRNLVVLAGDTHNAWASDLRDAAGQAVGVEFATPGVSSPGLEASRLTDSPEQVAEWMVGNLATLRYADTQHRGFMVLTATAQACSAQWHFVSTVKSADYTHWASPVWQTVAGQRWLVPA